MVVSHINKYREDLEVRWVTNLSEDRKGFYLIATQLDPHTNFLTFRDNKYFPTSWKDEGNGFLAEEFKRFYSEIQYTQVDRMYYTSNLELLVTS